MKPALLLPSVLLLLTATVPAAAAEDTVSTAVFSKISPSYKREYLANGSPKPEFFALANGGVVGGTTRDSTAESVTFPEIAKLTLPLLYRQGYRYASNAPEATLLLVIHWGNTIPYNDINYQQSMVPAGKAMEELQQLQRSGAAGSALDPATAALDTALMGVESENMTRNLRSAPNARLLGYIDDINDNNDMRRFVGGQRYNELLADVEEPRYYVIISAYDFREATQNGKQKLLWVTRVSVATTGNRFDDSMNAMLKNAAKYFGQDSGKLIRGEESRGRVDLGELKFLGTEPATPQAAPEDKK